MYTGGHYAIATWYRVIALARSLPSRSASVI